MRRVSMSVPTRVAIVGLVLASLMPGAGASPVMPPPELWVMDPDGTSQERLTDLDWSGEPRWAPDSTRLVVSTVNGLRVVDAHTGEMTDITSGRDPDWAPTDETIVFSEPASTENTYDEQIYLVQADGSERRLLVDTDSLDTHPSWSPDGEEIAFVSGPGSGSPGRLHVVGRDGEGLRAIGSAAALYVRPAWSPDGLRLAFATFDYRLRLIDADGGNEHEVPGFENSSSPTWCPDGTLYFSGWPTHQSPPGIYRYSPEGLSQFVIAGGDPDCGPDGQLAYSYRGDIHRLDPGELGTPNLTNSEERSESAPAWSPDGEKIAYANQLDIPDPIVVERSVTLRLRGHLVASGRLTSAEESCVTLLKLQRLGDDGWQTLEKFTPEQDGRYRIAVRDRAGFYRVRAPRRYTIWGTWECSAAESSIARHRH
jgi:Tol biopolymer transport system component